MPFQRDFSGANLGGVFRGKKIGIFKNIIVEINEFRMTPKP
jgi:hypothetical protein